VGSRVNAGKLSKVLMVLAAALALLSATAGSSGDHVGRRMAALLAVLVGALALGVRFRSWGVLVFEVQPDRWINNSDAYEYLIKPREVGARRHVTVTMVRPDGAEQEVAADVRKTPAGQITVRSGSPEHVTVYVE
jgi:hypothetical protein